MSDPHDWEIIASHDPYYGVLAEEAFLTERLDTAAREAFYASGAVTITQLLENMDRALGARPTLGRALDVGCGVGRLSYAMAREMPAVVGYDVSRTMVEIAREFAPENLVVSSEFPAGPFDWINSFIVFQHIPPAEGLALLDRCLAAAGPNAFLSLHFTSWRDTPPVSRRPTHRLRAWLRRRAGRKGEGSLSPLIRMYDYDLGEVLRRVMLHGFSAPALLHEQHGVHHGAWIFARRS